MVVHTPLLHRLDAVIYSYSLPLLQGGMREGLVLRLDDRWGDICPYPGRSHETLSQCFDQLMALINGNNQVDFFPSVQFALENIRSTPRFPIAAPLYAFLTGTPDEILYKADQVEKQGYTVAKVKISSLETGKKLLDALNGRFRLRIDCNHAFSFDDAVELFSPYTFDFIEDPIFETDRLPEFPFPFALDEHLAMIPFSLMDTYPHLRALILKPTILGGQKGCAPFIEYAQKRNLKIIFSPAFESGLGLLQILFLSQHLNLMSEPLGLDTYRFLKSDFLMQPLDFSSPVMKISDLPQINSSALKEIAHGKCQLPDC